MILLLMPLESKHLLLVALDLVMIKIDLDDGPTLTACPYGELVRLCLLFSPSSSRFLSFWIVAVSLSCYLLTYLLSDHHPILSMCLTETRTSFGEKSEKNCSHQSGYPWISSPEPRGATHLSSPSNHADP